MPGGVAAPAISGTVDCTGAVIPQLLQTGLPDDVTLEDGGDVTCAASGDTVECNVEHDSGDDAVIAVATILCTG